MSLTFNSKTFTADSFQQNAIGYVGPAKSVTMRDDVMLRRTAPKPTEVFSGVGRASAKITRTLALTNAKTLTGDAIIEANVSVPVGFTSADVDALVADFAAYVASAEFKTLVKTQKINF